jgi:hypothetical protein
MHGRHLEYTKITGMESLFLIRQARMLGVVEKGQDVHIPLFDTSLQARTLYTGSKLNARGNSF